MCAADEITLVNAGNRADLDAGAAAGAFIVIYSCEVVYHLDSSFGAGLFAFAAGNTAVLTELADLSALIVVITFNNDSCRVVY